MEGEFLPGALEREPDEPAGNARIALCRWRILRLTDE
jgi:hypothetical protein